MTYQQAAEWLHNLTDPERSGLTRAFGRRLSLDTTVALMDALGHPEQDLPAVHIAGTKGKGSVAAMIEAAAHAAGHRTGLFTSPHLVSWRERIQIDGVPISEDEVAHLAERVRPVAEQIDGPRGRGATFFEVYFAMAMLAFADHEVDLAVVETGLGGRLDATNVITPLLSIITTLGRDHTRILGESIEQIAGEKAGIIKPGVPAVSAPQPPGALKIMEATAAAQGCALAVARPMTGVMRPPSEPEQFVPGERPRLTQTVRGDYDGQALTAELSLLGDHQLVNAGVAARACEALTQAGVAIGAQAFGDGLTRARWPARVEILATRPWLVLDCAHNPESARALMSALRRHLKYERLALVLGVSADKDAARIADELREASYVVLTQADMPRAMPAPQLAELTAGTWDTVEVIEDAAQALAAARDWAGEADCICVTGSFFVVGELMGRACVGV